MIFRNDRKKLILTILTALFLAPSLSCVTGGLLSDSTGFTYAATSAEITAGKARIDENKKKVREIKAEQSKIQQKLEELTALKSNAASYIEELDRQMEEVNEELRLLEEDMESLDAEILTAGADLKKAEEKEEAQYQSMKKRIRYMYENSGDQYLLLLFDSGSLADFLNRAEYLEKITGYDRQMLDAYADIRQSVAEMKTGLEAQRKELESSKAAVRQRIEELERLEADKKSEIEAYEAGIEEADANIRSMKSDISGLQKAIQAEENNIAAIEARIRAQEEERRKKAKANGQSYETGSIENISFQWPCPASSRITSTFGDRESPVAGASTNHKGIDIGAAEGSGVYAAAGGTVVIATYSTSAGNYIMISHGSGVYTVYMHLSSMAVSEGREVAAGEQIGKVGSTGYSTGPHLHFGIRYNGNYVDPLSYVSP